MKQNLKLTKTASFRKINALGMTESQVGIAPQSATDTSHGATARRRALAQSTAAARTQRARLPSCTVERVSVLL
jgi:hypothetical protein